LQAAAERPADGGLAARCDTHDDDDARRLRSWL
jgi:hypothetical protein